MEKHTSSNTAESARKSGSLPLRVVLLAVLLFAVNTWLVRHLGAGFGEFALVNSFLAFVSLALGILAKDAQESFTQGLRSAFARSLSVPVLLALYLLAFTLSSFVSSVTLLAAGHAGAANVELRAEGVPDQAQQRKQLQGPEGSVQFWTLVSPFGSAFYLQADGFLREPIDLFPWFGATLRVSDLTPYPSILVRIPHQFHGSLKNATLNIRLANQQRYTVPLEKHHAAVLLGPPSSIPERNRENWRSQLRALPGVPEALREMFFRNWIEPVHQGEIPAPAPGETISVQFITAGNKPVAGQTFTVASSPFQDILLIKSGEQP